MDFATAAMVLNILSKKNNLPLAQGVAKGDESAIKTVLDMLNLDGGPKQEDYDQVIGLGKLFGNAMPGGSGSGGKYPTYAPDINRDKLSDDISVIRNTLAGGTAGKAIQLATAGVKAIGNGVADIADNEGNYLAKVLLANGRTNSARQNEMYGPSRREQAAESMAADTLKRHGNTAAVARNIANLAADIGGYQRGIDMSAGNMALMRQMPLSSAALDYAGRIESNMMKGGK